MPELKSDIALTYSIEMSPEQKINHIIQNLRFILGKQPGLQMLTNRNSGYKAITKRNCYDIDKDNFRDDGEATIALLRDVCSKKHGMYIYKYDLSTLSELFTEEDKDLQKQLEGNKHSFAIIGSNGKNYIVDCAYRQFFSLSYNIDSKDLGKMDPGIFMLMDEKRRKFAEQMLKNGYIELTEENLKLYLDGFVMAAAKDVSIKTPSGKQYAKSIVEKKKTIYSKFIQYSNQDFSDKDSEKYIVSSEPYIADDDILQEYDKTLPPEKILEIIVRGERKELQKDFNLNTHSLAGLCVDSTRRVILDCTSKGLDSAMVLRPGDCLGEDTEGHNCTIVNIGNKSYLIDCTYRQFFRKKHDSDAHCGYYMLQDEKRKEVAEQILKYGWIEATPENIKAYMDGFEMARKRSLEETGISPEEYVKRLAELKQWPIQIVTPKSICEAGEKSEITPENLNSGAEAVKGLVENLLGMNKSDKNPEEVGDN